MVAERSSPSRVRFAAPNNGAPLTAPGRSEQILLAKRERLKLEGGHIAAISAPFFTAIDRKKMGKLSLSLWCRCVSETGGFPKLGELWVWRGMAKLSPRGAGGGATSPPVIVSDRVFLSGLLARRARLRFTGWEPA